MINYPRAEVAAIRVTMQFWHRQRRTIVYITKPTSVILLTGSKLIDLLHENGKLRIMMMYRR